MIRIVCLVGLIAFVFVGCFLKADPAADAGFVTHPEKLAEHRERYPLNEVWVDPQYLKQKDRFDKMIIAPVDITHLMRTGDWRHLRTHSNDSVRKEAKELAKYFNETLRAAFLTKENKKVAIVDRSGINTLRLELAIVELIPTDVLRNALGDVAGFFVLGGELASAGSGGSIAIEGRLRDTFDNKVLMEFKDREIAKIRPIDLSGLSAYAHARESIRDWSEQAVELMNTPISHKVSDSSPITLSPW